MWPPPLSIFFLLLSPSPSPFPLLPLLCLPLLVPVHIFLSSSLTSLCSSSSSPTRFPLCPSFRNIFSRIPISQTFIDMVIGRLRSDDVYNQVHHHHPPTTTHTYTLTHLSSYTYPSLSHPFPTYHRLKLTRIQSTAAQRWRHRQACSM